MRKITLFLTVVLGLAASGTARAVLIERDFLSPGDGLLTFDDQSGLEWLDLTETQGSSFNEVQSLVLPGGAYEGFRVVTPEEAGGLLSSFGVAAPTVELVWFDIPLDAGNQFINLLGVTASRSLWDASIGTFDPGLTPNSLSSYRIQVGEDFVGSGDFARVRLEGEGADSTGGFGTYLVREAAPIPEPNAAVLFGVGAVVVGVALRRRAGRPSSRRSADLD